MSRKLMSRKVSRRAVLAGTAAGAAALTRFPAPAVAQDEPFKLGLLTVKTGPLAQGGIQMEQGVLTYLKETNYTIGGRKVDFVSADTGGNPAGTKTKAQELVERDNVDVILGPLAAFELYAINDYVQQHKMPMLSLAAADDLTQRTPNPYLLRASATSSQAMQPMGHYAATELKLKRVVLHRRGFRLRLRADGRLPGGVPEGRRLRRQQAVAAAGDARLHALCRADQRLRRRLPGLRRIEPAALHEAYASAGLKYPVVTGETGGDDALLKSYGDEAIGLVSCCPYTLDVETDANKRFVDGMLKNYNAVPGQYAALLYVNCQVVDAALKATGGDASDKEKFMAALKAVNLTDTPRGPIKFDHLGNVVGNFYVRRVGTQRRQIRAQALERGHQDLRERQPVLDLAREGVSRPPGLLARLSAADQVLSPPVIIRECG